MQQILVVIELFLCFRFQFFNRQASIEKRMFAHKPSFFLHIACDRQRFGATELLVFYLLVLSLFDANTGELDYMVAIERKIFERPMQAPCTLRCLCRTLGRPIFGYNLLHPS